MNSSIFNAYGPTENTVWSFVHELGEGTIAQNGLVPIGKPISGFDYHINKGLEDIGELLVTGDQVFDGYVNRDRKTKEVLAEFNDYKYYKTGDIVKEQSNGDIMYLNRLDNQVQINGYRVELGEVEYKINTLLNIQNSIAFVKENDNQLVAVLERKHELNKEEKKELMSFLPFYMQPKKFFYLENFPLNSNSKIDRKFVKAEFNEN
jgi:long-subunit acyl-CoA synthetase (AMP-forming)